MIQSQTFLLFKNQPKDTCLLKYDPFAVCRMLKIFECKTEYFLLNIFFACAC